MRSIFLSDPLQSSNAAHVLGNITGVIFPTSKTSCIECWPSGQVDTFILDFEKAFDTPPQELPKSKLFSYGIGGNTLKWIDSFLCFRQQRIVVNGVKSDWASVLSGVPQGTALGPLLFSLYINDISSDIKSEIRLFADDCVCYREIKDEEDNETSEGYWSIGFLGKEVGYEISTWQMQYDAADKKTDQEDLCFTYLSGNWPWKLWKH